MISLPSAALGKKPASTPCRAPSWRRRDPEAFYLGYGVPDPVAGRLDMIVLHLGVAAAAIEQGARRGDADRPAAVRPVLLRDIDDPFREMGVGDLAVFKEMQRVAEAFYGRANAYERALADASATALRAAVARNVYSVTEPPLGARRLAALYARGKAGGSAEQEPACVSAREA